MENKMATSNSNNLVNPNAREAMNRFKMEAAAEMGVNLKQGYNGDLTSRQAGSIGGQMVKKMIAAYENGKQGRGISAALLSLSKNRGVFRQRTEKYFHPLFHP